MTPVGLRVRELRKIAGLTQAQLAEAAQIRVATLSELERGNTSSVHLDVLDRLARVLKVEPGYLIVRTKGRRRR